MLNPQPQFYVFGPLTTGRVHHPRRYARLEHAIAAAHLYDGKIGRVGAHKVIAGETDGRAWRRIARGTAVQK